MLGCATAAPQLVQYPNGAVAPFDPNNAKVKIHRGKMSITDRQIQTDRERKLV